jgi:hypothetical protein
MTDKLVALIETITHLLNECEYSKMVWRKLGITDMSITNLLGLTLRRSELEIRRNVIALVFRKQLYHQMSKPGSQ